MYGALLDFGFGHFAGRDRRGRGRSGRRCLRRAVLIATFAACGEGRVRAAQQAAREPFEHERGQQRRQQRPYDLTQRATRLRVGRLPMPPGTHRRYVEQRGDRTAQ